MRTITLVEDEAMGDIVEPDGLSKDICDVWFAMRFSIGFRNDLAQEWDEERWACINPAFW